MSPEEFSSLFDLMENSYFTVIEALAILAIESDESDLEIEDKIMIAGLEPCDNCTKWVSSSQIQGTDEESLCPECYEEA